MKNYLLLIFCFLVLAKNSIGQSNVIFKESFNNNQNNWKLYNDQDFKVQIKRGKLFIQKFEINRLKNGCLWYNKIIPGFNTKNNFSISYYAKVISHDDVGKTIDFQWGNLTKCDTCSPIITTLHQIDISPKGIRLSYFESKKGWTYFNWSKNFIANSSNQDKETSFSSIFKNHRFNKIEINQIDNDIIINVNNKLVYKKAITRINGNSIGIQQCLKSHWKMKNLIIKQA